MSPASSAATRQARRAGGGVPSGQAEQPGGEEEAGAGERPAEVGAGRGRRRVVALCRERGPASGVHRASARPIGPARAGRRMEPCGRRAGRAARAAARRARCAGGGAWARVRRGRGVRHAVRNGARPARRRGARQPARRPRAGAACGARRGPRDGRRRGDRCRRGRCRRGRRARALGPARSRCARGWRRRRQEGQRVVVAVAGAGVAHAEVEVRRGRPSATPVVPDRPDALARRHAASPRAHGERGEVEVRGVERPSAVRMLDRQARRARRAREADLAARRGHDRRADGRRDVDAAVLAGAYGSSPLR